MRSKTLLTAGCLLLLSSYGASAQSLERTLSQTPETSSEIDAERAKLRAIEERVPQARSGLFPKASLIATIGRQQIETRPSSNNFLGTPASFGLLLSQPIYDGFKTYNSIQKAVAERAAGLGSYGDKEQSILLNVVVAYENLRRDRQIIAMRQEALSSLKWLSGATKKRFEAGELSRTDVSQSESRLQLAMADLAQAQSELAASEAEFLRGIGPPSKRLIESRLPKKLLPASLEEAQSIALAQNPALLAAQDNARAALYAVKIARADQGPVLNAESSWLRESDPVRSLDRRSTAQVGLRLSMPILDGGLAASRIREAKAVEWQRDAEIRTARNLIMAGVERTFGQLRANEMRVAASQRQIGAAQAALKGVMEEAKVGERSTLDVLDAEREVVNARIGLAQAQRDRIVSAYALAAAIGRMQASSFTPYLKAGDGDETGSLKKPKVDKRKVVTIENFKAKPLNIKPDLRE